MGHEDLYGYPAMNVGKGREGNNMTEFFIEIKIIDNT